MSKLVSFVVDSNFYNNFKSQKVPFQYRSLITAKVIPTTKEALLGASILGMFYKKKLITEKHKA